MNQQIEVSSKAEALLINMTNQYGNPGDLRNKILAQIKDVYQKEKIVDAYQIETDKSYEPFKKELAKFTKAREDLEQTKLQLRKLIVAYATITKDTA